jgi:hypothetical protein
VLAAVIWCDNGTKAPAPNGKVTRTHGPFTTEFDAFDGMTIGDWLRKAARQEFGRGIASRWFN